MLTPLCVLLVSGFPLARVLRLSLSITGRRFRVNTRTVKTTSPPILASRETPQHRDTWRRTLMNKFHVQLPRNTRKLQHSPRPPPILASTPTTTISRDVMANIDIRTKSHADENLTVGVSAGSPLPREGLLGLHGRTYELALGPGQRDAPPRPAGQADAARSLDLGVAAHTTVSRRRKRVGYICCAARRFWGRCVRGETR